ncbi:MAG TPA: hypothetical protein VGQ71_03540, partial [Terriglobales bacterium]|nr:hypothetical protein [Terriglobales bacterium]
MFARFDQISLRARLALGFLLMILLIFAASGTAGWSHRYTIHALEKFFDKEDKIDNLSFKASVALLAARRYEKDFLLKVKEFGYEETRARYATRVRFQIADLRENMNEIQTLSIDPNDVREAQAIAVIASRYEAGFLKVAENYGR